MDWCQLLVDYCDVFISCLDSHSNGTHSLQRVHWWASDVNLNFSKSVLMNKQAQFGCPEGEYIFSKFVFFGWTIPLIWKLNRSPVTLKPVWITCPHNIINIEDDGKAKIMHMFVPSCWIWAKHFLFTLWCGNSAAVKCYTKLSPLPTSQP